jgi:hypothetical protein
VSYIAPAVLEEWQRLAADPDACGVCGCHRWAVTGDGSMLVCDVCHTLFCYTVTHMKKVFTTEEARTIGDSIGIDWNTYDVEEFRLGLAVELEHGSHDPQTNVTNDDIPTTAKIALAHMKEIPDYYTRLANMEKEGEVYWEAKKKQ